MSIDTRLNKLMPALSARERAILVLESWKKGEQEDSSWRSTIPDNQRAQFNRFIGLMNGSVIQAGQYITILEQQVEKLELRQCWLVATVLWDEQIDAIRRATRLALKEPITRSEYQAQQAALDEEWVPVPELAEILAGRHDGWLKTDYEEDEDGDEPEISDAAWDRVVAEKQQEIRKAVAAGQLTGRGRGANLRVQEGAFNAWAGTSTSPAPEHLLAYRVLPDEEADAVASERLAQDGLYKALDLRRLVLKNDPEQERVLDVLAGHLRSSLASHFSDLWEAIQAVELVLAEVAAEFDGADPVRPLKREMLDAMKAKMLGLGEQLILLDVEVELTEPDEEMLALIRTMVRMY